MTSNTISGQRGEAGPGAHPEEMNARVELSLGGGRSFVATARATPAGLIAVGILVSAVLLSAAALARAGRVRHETR